MRRYTLYNRICSSLLTLVMAAALVLSMIPAVSAAEYEGSCGDGLSWSFADGTLTITGSGAMTDFSVQEDVPWYSFRDQILRVQLPDGLTGIGNMAFRECKNLTSVTLPAAVTVIGNMAFYRCDALEIVRLNQGLKKIGENAFKECFKLQNLTLPDTLTSLGADAFSRCKAITTITVPASVTYMGAAVFAYCDGLIRADIQAPLDKLPQWTFYSCDKLSSVSLSDQVTDVGTYGFYGCESLNVVYYGDEPGDEEQLRDQINESFEDYYSGSFSSGESGNEGSYYGSEVDENGDIIAESSTVTQTEESVVTVVVSENVSNPEAEQPPAEVVATVTEEEGWDQVVEAIKDAADQGNGVDATVYVAADGTLPQTVVDALAGRDVTLEVRNGDNTSFVLDFSQMKKNGSEAVNVDLSYDLTRLEETKFEVLQGCSVFQVAFRSTIEVPAQIKIRLPLQFERKSATLYQVESDGTLTMLQSVLVDTNAIAHYYVASVDSSTTYLIGIDVPDADRGALIIPEDMKASYGISYDGGVEYVITGRKSSWNMELGQVTWILAGVMGLSVVVVGAVMFALNKRRLKMGYPMDDSYDTDS